jgi:hypothetical protein
MRRTRGSHSVIRPVSGWGRSAKTTVETASETRWSIDAEIVMTAS